MVNVGVVGLGFMGQTHLKAYHHVPDARIVAVCDAVRQPENGVLKAVGGNVGDDAGVTLDMSQVTAYRELDAFLAHPDLQLVDLCVPTPLHRKLSIQALDQSKHVICEKPMARSPEDAKAMVEAAAAASTYFMPAMCMRFWPGWDWLKRVVDDGTYGPVLCARFRRVSSPPGWSRDSYFKGSDSGGALLDLHIHDVDFIQHCLGRPRRVFARGLTRFSGAIDHVVAQFDLGTDAVVYAEGSWIQSDSHGFNMTFTVTFEKATIDFDLKRGDEALMVYPEGGTAHPGPSEGIDGYVGELQHMVESIRDGHAPTRVTAADGLSSVEICAAEEQSVKTGQPVELTG